MSDDTKQIVDDLFDEELVTDKHYVQGPDGPVEVPQDSAQFKDDDWFDDEEYLTTFQTDDLVLVVGSGYGGCKGVVVTPHEGVELSEDEYYIGLTHDAQGNTLSPTFKIIHASWLRKQ